MNENCSPNTVHRKYILITYIEYEVSIGVRVV